LLEWHRCRFRSAIRGFRAAFVAEAAMTALREMPRFSENFGA